MLKAWSLATDGGADARIVFGLLVGPALVLWQSGAREQGGNACFAGGGQVPQSRKRRA